ncbi:MAG: NlpC/P60 family protein [Treponema sp.]|nr:NlpC/P60 family protein [Treponema sp.]
MVSPVSLAAAPLQYGFYRAPSSSASPTERDGAFSQARERLLSIALGYKGTPYRLGGTTRRGMDCSGFVYRSFHSSLGVSVPRTSESMFLWTERIARNELQPGDLVFFRTTGTARITHVGIYTGDGYFIHSASQGRRTGVIFSSLGETYWASVYAGAGRALPRAELSVLNTAETQRTRRFFFRGRDT